MGLDVIIGDASRINVIQIKRKCVHKDMGVVYNTCKTMEIWKAMMNCGNLGQHGLRDLNNSLNYGETIVLDGDFETVYIITKDNKIHTYKNEPMYYETLTGIQKGLTSSNQLDVPMSKSEAEYYIGKASERIDGSIVYLMLNRDAVFQAKESNKKVGVLDRLCGIKGKLKDKQSICIDRAELKKYYSEDIKKRALECILMAFEKKLSKIIIINGEILNGHGGKAENTLILVDSEGCYLCLKLSNIEKEKLLKVIVPQEK